MKKLKLGAKDVQDILSRDELRTIGGGTGSGIGSGGGRNCYCGPNGDCLVSGPEEHTCTQICKGFENGC